MNIEEIRERYLFHDRSFKASGVEPDQEHHDIGALLTALAAARKELEEQAWRPIAEAAGLKEIWGITKDGRTALFHWNDESYHKNPRPHWHCTLWGKNWSRANQPIMFSPLPQPPKNEVV